MTNISAFNIFIAVWLGTIFIALLSQGIWGEELDKEDRISLVVVALIWPFGVALLLLACPFAAAYYLRASIRRARDLVIKYRSEDA
ncbi:MAG: hypothetical protein ACK4PC_03555 [Sphingopyxis sp.]